MTNRCKSCDELFFEWQVPHKCKPKWYCWFDDGDDGYYETDDGGTAVYADDAREAAAHLCATESMDIESWHADVIVQSVLTGEWCKVFVESSVEWYASSYNNPTPFAPKPCREEGLRPPKESASWELP